MKHKDITLNPKMFNRKYRRFFNQNKRIQILFGGGSSGKSYAIMTFVVLWALRGQSILVVRKVAASIKHSAWSEVLVAISRLKLEKYFTINKSDKTITSKVGDGYIMFKGIDDSEKIKSIRPMSDNAIDTVVAEEGTELFPDDFTQLMIRQRGGSKFKKKIILIFNPIHTEHWIYKRFFKDIEFDEDGHYEDDSIYIQKTTYKDNEFLTKEDIDTLEGLKEISELHYNIYCLGNWGVLGDRIFENIEIIKMLPEDKNYEYLAGIDFGWADPTAYVLCAFDGQDIFVVDEVVGSKMDVDVLASRIRNDVPVIGDSEDPRSIAQLQSLGIPIKGAKKGAGSVFGGIMWLKRRKIYVLENCTNTLKSFNNYAWEKDKKTGESIDKPNHEFSHCIDAIRYGFERYSRSKGTTIQGVHLKY